MPGKGKKSKVAATPATPKKTIRKPNRKAQLPLVGSPLPMGPVSDTETAGLSELQKDSLASVMDLLLDIHSKLDAQQKEIDELKAAREREPEGTSTLSVDRAHPGSSRGHS